MLQFLLLVALACRSGAAESIPAFSVPNDELVAMSKKLRSADENKVGYEQFRLNYQDHTNSHDMEDNARESLFSRVDESVFSKPSYSLFLSLTDNFYREAGKREPRVSVEEETRETNALLDTLMKSKPWQELYSFLKEKKHPFAVKGDSYFREWMEQLWFKHYSRAKGVLDTSGFEHVFIGEEKNGEVSGLHNWIRFYMLEKNATEKFDYKGFIVKRGNVMASVKFTWNGILKKSGSLLFGTSPEFEMALYTLCFLSRRGTQKCEVELDACPLSITSYDLVQNDKVFIGTVYPTAGQLTEQCKRFRG